MDGPMKLKKVTPVVEDTIGVCLWVMPDGSTLGDEDGRMLSLQGNLNDLRREKIMRRIMAAMVEENSTDVIVDDVFSSQSISPVADKVEEIDPFKLVRQGTLSKKMKSKAYRLRKKYESLDGEVASKYQDPK